MRSGLWFPIAATEVQDSDLFLTAEHVLDSAPQSDREAIVRRGPALTRLPIFACNAHKKWHYASFLMAMVVECPLELLILKGSVLLMWQLPGQQWSR